MGNGKIHTNNNFKLDNGCFRNRKDYINNYIYWIFIITFLKLYYTIMCICCIYSWF